MTNYIPFWGKDPSILLNKNEIFQFWPMPNMNMEEKMNAISRSVIVLSLLGFLFTFSSKFLLMGIITLLVIWFVYRSYGTSSSKKTKEGFYSNGKNKSADIK